MLEIFETAPLSSSSVFFPNHLCGYLLSIMISSFLRSVFLRSSLVMWPKYSSFLLFTMFRNTLFVFVLCNTCSFDRRIRIFSPSVLSTFNFLSHTAALRACSIWQCCLFRLCKGKSCFFSSCFHSNSLIGLVVWSIVPKCKYIYFCTVSMSFFMSYHVFWLICVNF